jgi:hypothetical protein
MRSAKPGLVRGAQVRVIRLAAQSSPQTHTLVMVAGLLSWQMKDSLHLWNYMQRFVVNLIE